MRNLMLAFLMCALILPAAKAAAGPNVGGMTGEVADPDSPGVTSHLGSQPYTNPSDGGAFRCDKFLVAGGISVRPSSIVIADGVWSLLVKAKDLDAHASAFWGSERPSNQAGLAALAV